MKKSFWKVLLLSALSSAFAFGCCLSSFSEKSYSRVRVLRDSHLSLVQENTDNGANVWSEPKLSERAQLIHAGFSEAKTDAQTACDKMRADNISLLEKMFSKDEALMREKNRLLTDAEAETILGVTEQAYSSVLRGECARAQADEEMCHGR